MADMDRLTNEQEDCDKLEELTGGPSAAFRLMDIWRDCEMAGRPDIYSGRTKRQHAETIFRRRASRERYSDEAINHYLSRFA